MFPALMYIDDIDGSDKLIGFLKDCFHAGKISEIIYSGPHLHADFPCFTNKGYRGYRE
jgi:hypothetical protein